MPEFIGELDCSPYPDGKTWFLLNPYGYRCADGTLVQVPEAFQLDFASTPQIFWGIVPPWGTYGFAAVIHDWNYWTQTVTRERADAIFLEGMTLSGVSLIKRRAMYQAVRWFGQTAWDDNQAVAAAGYSRIGTRNSPPIPQWSRA